MKYQKIIFLDRDGIINKEKGYICNLKDFKLYKDVNSALKYKKNYKYIIITNQSSISRGICKEKQIKKIHNYLKNYLKSAYKIDLFGIYYCPHKDEDNCNCRKPKIGLLKEVEKKLNVNKRHSFFIGDSTVDIKTANNYKIQSILILRGHKGKDNRYKAKPDYIFFNLSDAMYFIKKIYPYIYNLIFKLRKLNKVNIKIYNKRYNKNIKTLINHIKEQWNLNLDIYFDKGKTKLYTFKIKNIKK